MGLSPCTDIAVVQHTHATVSARVSSETNAFLASVFTTELTVMPV